MKRVQEFLKHLKRGHVYRREDLTRWSKSVDRHLGELVENGTLIKLSPGMYSYPKKTVFGDAPPSEEELVRTYLKDDRFLLTSPNFYNTLGVGTTQLYNKTVVYNHKRNGEVKLGNRVYNFVNKAHFPSKLSREFLVVDLVNNLNLLAEDPAYVIEQLKDRITSLDGKKLNRFVANYGNSKTKKLLTPLLESLEKNG